MNPEQLDAVTHGDGPILILAGAGSGKTRVITHRIAHLIDRGVRPWHILAVTFTNKAAREMQERVYALTRSGSGGGGAAAGAWISTFHSFCAHFLRSEGERHGLDRNFTIYDEDDQKKILRECLKELNLDEKKLRPGMLAGRISREKDQLMDAESYAIAALASGDPNRAMLASVYSLYQKKLDRALALDFGDLILKTVDLLENHPTLKEKTQERFRHVLVDEYQDTNRAQYVLTKILAARHRNICVVGDDDQSIYSWRGADIRNILDFEKDYPDPKIVKLEQNYRSTAPILSAAWKLVRHNEMRKEKKLWTVRKSDAPVTAEQLGNEAAEAAWVAEQIAELRVSRRMDWSGFSVFYRTNAQSRVLEDAFRAARIPYVLVGSVRFYERAEVKDVLAYLRLIANPKDDLSCKRVLNVPPRGIGKTSLEIMESAAAVRALALFESLALPEVLAELPSRARAGAAGLSGMARGWIAERESLSASALLDRVLSETRLLELLKEDARTDPDAAGRLDNIQELMNAVEEFEEKSPDKRLPAYLEQVSLVTDLDSGDKKSPKVTLMTVHIAKGLEFPVVFLTGLEEGLFPLGESQFSQEDLEEERRLAYVGMTRAKDEIFLSCAASRRLFGQTRWNLPSRFIEEAGVRMKEAASSPENASPEPAPRALSGPFRVGQRVRHADFGAGRITDRSGSGDDLKVVVVFDSGQWKKLLVKYAPLERIR
ncbi:MAG: hypothetical protein A2902_05500 [Elusimicrobia bacterium RIFCSPLOWO2_01_FULL_64_13]|nr:MAG: hypothetical protein A2902_05500 [Elusimicrobia bacterium RIFCSPLOWO2_01_FULL_64_13]